jgi:hypothetical protein
MNGDSKISFAQELFHSGTFEVQGNDPKLMDPGPLQPTAES